MFFWKSICHPWPVSAPSKGSDFKIKHFSSARTCRLEFVSSKEREISLHQRTEKEGDSQRHLQRNATVPIFILLGIQSPIRGFCNHNVIVAALTF